jgi:hypothetical protein
MKINGMTPDQFAYDIAIGYLSAVYQGFTADLDDLTPAQKHDVKEAISKLHNELLDKSGMDGLPLTYLSDNS